MPWITKRGRRIFAGSGFPNEGVNYTNFHKAHQEDEARKKVMQERLKTIEKKKEQTKGFEVKLSITDPSLTIKRETTETTIKKKKDNGSS